MPLSITLEQTSSRKQRTLHLTKPKRNVRILTVRLPKWFLHRQYDLQLMRATSGWPFTLNVRTIVPTDSPFFEACRDGDIETIKSLLSNQQASIYDRDPHGFTAFHSAIYDGQLEVCKLLRHAGIFAQFDDDDYRHSLFELEFNLDDFTGHKISLLRVAAPFNDPGPEWFKEYLQAKNDNTVLVDQDPVVELLSLLNSSQSDTPILNVSHLKAFFEFRIRNTFYGNSVSFMPYIARVLSNISIIREITAAPEKYAWIVYALAREVAGAYYGGHSFADQWRHSIRRALCAIVHAGLNPHQSSGKLEPHRPKDEWLQDLSITPLGLLCMKAMKEGAGNHRRIQRRWSKGVSMGLQAWLRGLHSAGIDLLQYAEAESVCYGWNPGLLAIPWKTDISIMVVTGLGPEDWRISLWEPCESHARLFWSLVEGKPVVPELAARIIEAFPLSASQDMTSADLPGSWPSGGAHVAEALKSWLLRETDVVLAQIEEDLPLLSEADFFGKWYEIDDILGLRQ
jgi:hypothetical protein